MDTLTHALSGALIARATEPRNKPNALPRSTRMWAGFWVAAFPDSDFILRFFDPWLYVAAHRGVTHSIVLLPLWALALALLLQLLYRGKYRWRAFYGVCALSIGVHIAGDVITSFGTMILAPFSDWRAHLSTTFIIDLYFTGIIVFGLLASAYWKSTRLPALLGSATLAAYVGMQAVLHHRAVEIGESYIETGKLESARAHALPQPFSPFHWMIVIEQPSAYRASYISLLRRELPTVPDGASWLRRVYLSYQPVEHAQWRTLPRYGESASDAEIARAAINTDAFARYGRFAMFPSVYRIDRAPEQSCVTFQDLRFALVDRELPFRYAVCLDTASPTTVRSFGPIN